MLLLPTRAVAIAEEFADLLASEDERADAVSTLVQALGTEGAIQVAEALKQAAEPRVSESPIEVVESFGAVGAMPVTACGRLVIFDACQSALRSSFGLRPGGAAKLSNRPDWSIGSNQPRFVFGRTSRSKSVVAANRARLIEAKSPAFDFDKIGMKWPDLTLNFEGHSVAGQEADPWGPQPSAEEVEAAVDRAERAREAALTATLASSLGRQEVAVRLGVTPQAVSDRRKRGHLLGIKRGREWWFPRWQFGDDGPLPGLAAVAKAYPGSVLALSAWVVQPHADLDGRTPAAELERPGGEDRVLALLEAIEAASW